MLLDCGDGQSETYLRELQRCMREAGCTGLDAIVITHWHWDHVGGIPGVVSRVSAGGVSPPPVRKFLTQQAEPLSKGEGAVDPYSIWPKQNFTHLADGTLPNLSVRPSPHQPSGRFIDRFCTSLIRLPRAC